MGTLRLTFLVTFLSLVLPPGVWAQDVGSGSFAGVVRDTSGGVLPGVTVEAASPALIEKVRTTVTDAEGRYRITGLRPGDYALTFTLPGFRTVRRDGLELTTGFSATVNAELSVGALEETITVTGIAPIVDTRNSTQQQVLSGEVVRELPVGKNSGVYVALLPGATQNRLSNMDVGGNKGETENQMGIHGGRPNDGITMREGNYDGHMFGPLGANALSSINPTTIQEVTLQLTGGLTAEAQTGGIQSNVIMRDGGNRFSGSFVADYANRSLQANNITDELAARGVKQAALLTVNRDLAIGIGGPIVRDRLWFFADARNWKAYSEFAGQYYNKLQGPNNLFYEPDFSRPGIGGTETKEAGLRLTWQATEKHKLTFSGNVEDTCNCYYQLLNGLISPEAAQHDAYFPYNIAQVKYSYPATNRLLVQAGYLLVGGVFFHDITDDQGVTSSNISVTDRLRNYRYGAPASRNRTPFRNGNITGSVSYVTGSHVVKVGGLYLRAMRESIQNTNTADSVTYTFAGRVPESITVFAYPNISKNNVTQTAFYVQDQWTIQNLTMNFGLRYDGFNGYAPAVSSPAGRWAPARNFPAVEDIVDWKDINPRLGAAYNLFGDDRTAVKVNIGRFSPYEHLGGLVAGAAPANLIVTSANRTWRDANGDFVPQEGELGPLSNRNFGTSVRNTAYADDLVRGWGKRSYSWQGSVSIQHELRDGFAVNVGYFRTWYGNFTATDNLLVGPSDYDSYCLTGPSNSLLPGGGGERICGLLALKPAAFGRVSTLVAPASNYGTQSEVYNGIDLTLNARFANGAMLSGGLATSQTVTDNCEIRAALPEMSGANSAPERFCHVAPPWSAATQVKLYGSYPLPWSLRATAILQNVPGLPTAATWVVGNAQVVPALGRPLAGGANATASVELIEPTAQFDEGRVTQLNLSLSRSFNLGANRRLNPTLDLFNLLNANPVLVMNTRYGPAWRNVSNILPPRMIKVGVRLDF